MTPPISAADLPNWEDLLRWAQSMQNLVEAHERKIGQLSEQLSRISQFGFTTQQVQPGSFAPESVRAKNVSGVQYPPMYFWKAEVIVDLPDGALAKSCAVAFAAREQIAVQENAFAQLVDTASGNAIVLVFAMVQQPTRVLNLHVGWEKPNARP